MSLLTKMASTNNGSFFQPGPTPNRPPSKPLGKAGRNLPASIAVGVGLGAAALALLLVSKLSFLALAVLISFVAEYEMAGAFARAKINLCLVPLWLGSVGMMVCAYLLGAEGLWAATIVTLVACVAWRLLAGASLSAVRDIIATTFVTIYLPFLAGFVVMMLNNSRHPLPVIFWILGTISNDIGGYVAGVLKGRHPMAPRVSPSKSWEGFAGSIVMTVVVLEISFLLSGVNWWWAFILAPFSAILATAGDLGESLIKRDLKLKDMSHLLPGHGGIMDRLDSLLVTAPLYFFATLFLFHV